MKILGTFWVSWVLLVLAMNLSACSPGGVCPGYERDERLPSQCRDSATGQTADAAKCTSC